MAAARGVALREDQDVLGQRGQEAAALRAGVRRRLGVRGAAHRVPAGAAEVAARHAPYPASAMTAGSSPPAPTAGAAVFDVERFGWTAPDRLEVAGRWSGVRGLRFMRPTLDVPGDGARRRLLAVLYHKPSPPVDRQQWVAAFPWEGDPAALEGATLPAAPSVIPAA